jgi:hypothetical protein
MKIAVFWVVAPCSLVEVYQRFRGPCCLHHQGDNPEDSHLLSLRNLLTDINTENVSHSRLSASFNTPSVKGTKKGHTHAYWRAVLLEWLTIDGSDSLKYEEGVERSALQLYSY